MPINNGFHMTEGESKGRSEVQKIYTCDEAIDMAGTGAYSRGLVLALSLALLSMSVDMFGFSVVVTGCACDFQLDHAQKSLLISTPFVGPIVMSYLWGYLSDTRGRRWSLLLGLWGGAAASTASAFSTHWAVLAALKIIATCLSSVAQSCTFAYLESCPRRTRSSSALLMTAALMLFILAYDVPAYFILNLKFSYDWVFITFTPWRLLTLVIAAPLAISALMLLFFHESPKFLLNAGKEELALEHLRAIWRKNGNIGVYPVTKMVLNEDSSFRRKDASVLSSALAQTAPLFRPPLRWTTLQLFYLTTVVFAINNGLVMWMPIIVEAFSAGLQPYRHASICSIIVSHHINTTRDDSTACVSSIDSRTLASGVAQGLIFSAVMLLMSWVGRRRRLFVMGFLCLPAVCSVAAVYNENSVASLVLYLGMISSNFCTGFLSSYYVELYPTTYRGMATCLSVMVSRLSGLAGVHFIGALVMTHCDLTFLSLGACALSGAVVAYFLPPDIIYTKTS